MRDVRELAKSLAFLGHELLTLLTVRVDARWEGINDCTLPVQALLFVGFRSEGFSALK